MLENLRKHPAQEKYMKVNTTSSRFKERFGTKEGASALLTLVGFEKKGQNYVYDVKEEDLVLEKGVSYLPIKDGKCPVSTATECLSECLHGLDGLWEEREKKITSGGPTVVELGGDEDAVPLEDGSS